MTLNYYLLDTFTAEKYKGNPTPVCVLNQALAFTIMHSLAMEFNAPVTVFVEPQNANNYYPIRYFTVTGEINACGHGTLGGAFVLLNEIADDKIVFETIEKVQIRANKENDLIYMEYPKFKSARFEIPELLQSALGVTEKENHFYCDQLETLFIELKHESKVKDISPDFKVLLESTNKVKEVVVMSQSENKSYDFILRSFCPWIGIDEDPVTGSIHSVLGPYWQEKLNKNKLVAYQASERGGHVHIRVLQNTVQIGGNIAEIINGYLHL